MSKRVTLDDDVVAALERLREKRNVGFKELVNLVTLRQKANL